MTNAIVDVSTLPDIRGVVHCKRSKYDVYIGRPSKWGNPFVIGKDGTREEVLEKYREWIYAPEQIQLRRDARKELKDKILGCYCAPKECHGDLLIKIANNTVLDSQSSGVRK